MLDLYLGQHAFAIVRRYVCRHIKLQGEMQRYHHQQRGRPERLHLSSEQSESCLPCSDEQPSLSCPPACSETRVSSTAYSAHSWTGKWLRSVSATERCQSSRTYCTHLRRGWVSLRQLAVILSRDLWAHSVLTANVLLILIRMFQY